MLPIVTAPNPVLSNIAQPVKYVDQNVLQLIDKMKKTLLATRDPEGVGLAAPQIGKSVQIFIAKQTPKSPFLIFINPQIIKASEKMSELKRPKKSKAPAKLEGCLSLPTIWGTVQRPSTVKVSYMDGAGAHHAKTFSGFLATIIQHEVDHLNGILFPKRVLEQKGKLYKSHKNEKNDDIFEEMEI